MRLTTDRVHVDEGAVAAATWFESGRCFASVAAAFSPNYLLFIQKSTTHTQIRDPQIETRLFPNSFAATSRQFSPIQIYESEKEISKCGRGLKTRSTPALARCYPRSFTFYLGNPFPRFLRSCFPD